jgi:nitrate reductase beta subunit
VYKLAKVYNVALPLHPEYRTMPMVWYIPPLSPIVDALRDTGNDGEDLGSLFGALDSLRIPIEYLAELFTAGDPAPVQASLRKLAAMRSYMRDVNLGRDPQPQIPESVGMTEESIYEMYRLLAIAKYEDRYIIPKAHAEAARDLEELACAVDYDGDPHDASGPFGYASGRPVPVAVETFHALKERQTTEVLIPLDAVRMNLRSWGGAGDSDD